MAPRRGLAQACFGGSDLHHYLIGPLVDRAANCLAQYLPVTDVAQVEISEAGKAYGEQARELLPGVHLVRVPGQADLMFCQEQGSFTQEELERLITPCRDAYLESSTVPGASPHSRFDTRDWVPLEP